MDKSRDRYAVLSESGFQILDDNELAQLSKEGLEIYRQRLKYYRDTKNAIDYAFNEGFQKGLATVLIARRMKAIGEPVEKIAQITGLSIETIETLKPY